MHNSCSHPWELTGVRTKFLIVTLVQLWAIDMRAKVVIDVPDVVIPGVDVETLINVEIVVVTVAAINLEFVVKVPTAVEVLAVV